MPNWCSNGITITGDKAQLEQLANLASIDGETIMERLVPQPEDLADGEWYQWCIDNWGTKWDMCELTAEYESDFIELTYETAWAPNIPFWTTISKRYPDLRMTHYYKEIGMGFTGVATYQEGNCDDKFVQM
jgi:hypothetical protein